MRYLFYLFFLFSLIFTLPGCNTSPAATYDQDHILSTRECDLCFSGTIQQCQTRRLRRNGQKEIYP